MAESPTHLILKDIVAEGLEKRGHKVEVEKSFINGRMDVYGVNEENGEELEVEVWRTNMPNRFVVRVVGGKLMGIDYSLEQNELEMKKVVWQQLQEEEYKPILREKDQYLICQQFLNLITSGKIQLESNRILDTLNEIFSYLRRKRKY